MGTVGSCKKHISFSAKHAKHNGVLTLIYAFAQPPYLQPWQFPLASGCRRHLSLLIAMIVFRGHGNGFGRGHCHWLAIALDTANAHNHLLALPLVAAGSRESSERIWSLRNLHRIPPPDRRPQPRPRPRPGSAFLTSRCFTPHEGLIPQCCSIPRLSLVHGHNRPHASNDHALKKGRPHPIFGSPLSTGHILSSMVAVIS